MEKVCNYCKHLRKNKTGSPVFYCVAFPDGIPPLLFGEEHTVPYPMQTGDTVFEPHQTS